MEWSQAIRERISTRDFCESVGLRPGRNGFVRCPFHPDERAPSLKVYGDARRGWHCFGCGKGGTVIDFAMAWYGAPFGQTVMRLNADFGLGLTRETPGQARARQREARRRAGERQRALAARQEAEAAYWACFDAYLACARRMDAYAPRRGEEADIRWAAAAALLPEVRDGYERAQDVWAAALKTA